MKKFFTAVILAVFILSAQIATAADWNTVKHCNTKAELARWIEEGRQNGQKEFNFTLANSNVTADEMVTEIAIDSGGSLKSPLLGNYEYYTYYVNEYPGTNVANAYLSSNKYQAWLNLSAEEQKLYNIAVGIVNEANKRNSDLEKARYLHDEICRRTTYYTERKRYYINENGDYIRDKNGNRKIKSFATAIGVLNNGEYGQSDCGGYSDAFYMLGRMCKLNVVRVGGGEHMWNAIKLDGKIYFIDVTWDDQKNTYEFFNKSAEFFRKEHSWNYLAF